MALFYEPPVLSHRGEVVVSALKTCFEANSEESLVHRQRAAQMIDDSAVPTDFTYGEVDLTGFVALLDALSEALKVVEPKWTPPRTFVDLGCGLGKSCLIAAAYWPSVEVSAGYDINSDICTGGQCLVRDYWPACNAVLTRDEPGRATQSVRVDYGDVCDPSVAWEHSDVMFSYWNAMSLEVKRRISVRAQGMKPGSIVMTTRSPINGVSAPCCDACTSGSPHHCTTWTLVCREWVDFERLPHETVYVFRKM